MSHRSHSISTACDYCRRLHERCDGNLPCARCIHRNKKCEFSIVPPPNKRQKIFPGDVPLAALAGPGAQQQRAAATSIHPAAQPHGQTFIQPNLNGVKVPSHHHPISSAPPMLMPRDVFGTNPWGALPIPPALHMPPPGTLPTPNFMLHSLTSASADGIPPFVAAMVAATGGAPPNAAGFFGPERIERQLSKRSAQMLAVFKTFRTVPDPIEAAKIAKYQLAFYVFGASMWEQLTVPEMPVMSAMQPLQSFATADEMCSAIEHLTILAEGALAYADREFSKRMLLLADPIMDRLIFEQSYRVRSDLLNRSVMLRCMLASIFFMHGEVRRSSALMVSAISNVNNPLPGHSLSPMLLMFVYAFHWAYHGDESSLEAAVRYPLLALVRSTSPHLLSRLLASNLSARDRRATNWIRLCARHAAVTR